MTVRLSPSGPFTAGSLLSSRNRLRLVVPFPLAILPGLPWVTVLETEIGSTPEGGTVYASSTAQVSATGALDFAMRIILVEDITGNTEQGDTEKGRSFGGAALSQDFCVDGLYSTPPNIYTRFVRLQGRILAGAGTLFIEGGSGLAALSF